MVSDDIKKFLDFVEETRSQHSMAVSSVRHEEKRLQDFLHAIEFETSGKERNKICTKLHRSRNERRKYKDIVEETEKVVQFFEDPQHKRTLEKMKQLLGDVRKVEKYHENRTYIPRVKE